MIDYRRARQSCQNRTTTRETAKTGHDAAQILQHRDGGAPTMSKGIEK
jgi:hypothetical protein